MAKTKLYDAVGVNYMPPYFWRAYCGDVMTLEKWIECLFCDNLEKAKQYFDGFTDKEILDYIYKNCGFRLKIYKS